LTNQEAVLKTQICCQPVYLKQRHFVDKTSYVMNVRMSKSWCKSCIL